MKLHPNQFEVNEAWIVFRLTRDPIVVEQEGPVHGIGLMDAASCFILGAIFIGSDETLATENIRELLEKGWAHKSEYPKKLMVSSNLMSDELETAAEAHGVSVAPTSEGDLRVFIGEAQEEFRKKFG